MVVIIVLSVLGAAASLAQPLLVQQVIALVQDGRSLGRLVWLLVALVVVAGLLSGFQHYLLQRTGEGVVLSSRRRLVGSLLRLPVSQFDARRTGDLVSRVGVRHDAAARRAHAGPRRGDRRVADLRRRPRRHAPHRPGAARAHRARRRRLGRGRRRAVGPDPGREPAGAGEGRRPDRRGRAGDQLGAHHPRVGRHRARDRRRRERRRGGLPAGPAGRPHLGARRADRVRRPAGVVPRRARASAATAWRAAPSRSPRSCRSSCSSSS